MVPDYVGELMRLIRGQLLWEAENEWGDPASILREDAGEKEEIGPPRFRLRH